MRITDSFGRGARGVISSVVTAYIVIGAVSPVYGTHFRSGHIEWKHVGPASNHTIEFTVQNSWRQDGISSPSGSAAYRCVNPASFVNQSTKLATVDCTGPVFSGKHNPGVGDVFVELIGSTRFNFGDSTSVGGPGGDPLLYLVTSADPVNNWVFGLALDPNSLPAVDTTIQHHYSNGNARTANINACCRVSACSAPNAHLNNPDDNYQVQAVVDVGDDNSSPSSSLPPVILCPQGGLCTFQIPQSDNELDPVTFRMSTTSEAGFTSQPGPPQCPNDGLHTAAISASGVYTWNTAGCRTAGSPGPNPPNGGCADASLNTLYSTQVMLLEGAPKNTKSALDFFIQLVPPCQVNGAPTFNSPPTPLCGSTVSGHPGQFLTFSVQAADPNNGDTVALNAAGVPSGGTFSPVLPTSGNPVNSSFSWTPTANDLGQHVITFTATDPCNAQQLCSITIDVSQEICNNGIDDDGDGLVDCFDPDCAGTPCDDANPCTSNDQCSGGVSGCVGGPPTNCDDGNGCTDDACDPAHGCTHSNNAAPCSDANTCTTADACANGACVGGPTLNCDDGNGCTADSCDQMLGCQHVLLPNCQPCATDADCDDHNACDGTESCVGGVCQNGTAPACDDGNACTDDSCDPGSGCTHTNNSSPCDDGNACTFGDTCSGGSCVGNALNCNDQNPCTDDSCDQQLGCQYVNNASPCDDDDACTTSDTCSNGICVGGPAPNCDDGNTCTDDSCDPENGCVHTDNTAPCDDGNACTTNDTCADGFCAPGAPLLCEDHNVCTDDSCDPASGCVYANNNAPCDDGNACTTGDTCAGGTCQSGPPTNCNDGNACTSDSCVPPTGCAHDPVPACCTTDGQCADTDQCTTNERCVNNACVSDPVSCDDGNVCTDDSCNPSTGCVHTNNNLSCDDGNVCTANDTCAGGVCAGTSVRCGDGILQASCGEQCDDGNTTSGDGCSATCQLEACGPEPASSCQRPAVPQSALILLKHKTPDAKDGVVWKWKKGSDTQKTDFGDPRIDDDYQLCIYSGSSPRLVLSAGAPAAGQCGGHPCWKAIASGFKYKRTDLMPDGIKKVRLKAGLNHTANIVLKGKGTNLKMPDLTTLTSPVVVQIRDRKTDKCWEAIYSFPPDIKSTSAKFKDRAD